MDFQRGILRKENLAFFFAAAVAAAAFTLWLSALESAHRLQQVAHQLSNES
jgi:hypothetical protein